MPAKQKKVAPQDYVSPEEARLIREAASQHPETKSRSDKLKEELDELLDEIDEVLESNAEDFVRQYVQKGGQ